MSEEPLVWSSAVEALFLRALKDRMTPQLMDRIRVAGIDLAKPLLPAYPWIVWIAAIDVTAETLYPALSRKDAHFELGQLTVLSYQDTLVGKATFAALRLFSARRVMDRLARSFRTSNNYTETQVTEVGPTQVEIRFNRVEPEGSFTRGVLTAGLPAAGVPTARVELTARDGVSATFRVEWGSPE